MEARGVSVGEKLTHMEGIMNLHVRGEVKGKSGG